MVVRSLSPVRSPFVRRWRIALYLAALCATIPLAVTRAAETPQPPGAHPRPSVEERRKYEERMLQTHPAKPGCFEAHYPDEHWIETKCLPPPRTPNPRARGPRPNTVGAGTDWFATVTSGNISQVTGSFDSVSGVVSLYGPKGGAAATVYPNTYALQMNANTFTTTVGNCDKDANCAGWEQFLFSQSQCAKVCVFIEYWLLNYPQPCPTNAAWTYYAGTPTTTPGCYLNTPAKDVSSAVPLSDLANLRVNATIQSGNDIVTVSDASGTLASASNPSVANLGAGWTGVEYVLVGDCCATEAFFTSTTSATLKVRVATVNGTTNAPNCASTFTGTTAETNNLNLTGGCTPSGGANPAIVFAESGGGPLPTGVSIGDPHLTTFHGAHYDFQHAGEYILAEADPDLQVQVRQTLITPANKPAIAVNAGAAVKMGADRFAATLKAVEVNGSPRAIADGQTFELAGGVTVVHRGSMYTVSRPSGDIVHINVLGDHVDVSVQLGATNASTVRGLLVGSGNAQHPFVMRNKTPLRGTITTAALGNFVESWRVEPRESLFSEEGRPRPTGAVAGLTVKRLDPAKAEQARKLCVEKGVKDKTLLDDCILDVSVTGKPELAESFVFTPKPKMVVHAR